MNLSPVSFSLAFLQNIGLAEWLIILAVMLLIFGRRLPEVGKSLGKGIVEFKKGLKGVEDDINPNAPIQNHPQNQQGYPQQLPGGQQPQAALPQGQQPYAQQPYAQQPYQGQQPAQPYPPQAYPQPYPPQPYPPQGYQQPGPAR